MVGGVGVGELNVTGRIQANGHRHHNTRIMPTNNVSPAQWGRQRSASKKNWGRVAGGNNQL